MGICTILEVKCCGRGSVGYLVLIRVITISIQNANPVLCWVAQTRWNMLVEWFNYQQERVVEIIQSKKAGFGGEGVQLSALGSGCRDVRSAYEIPKVHPPGQPRSPCDHGEVPELLGHSSRTNLAIQLVGLCWPGAAHGALQCLSLSGMCILHPSGVQLWQELPEPAWNTTFAYRALRAEFRTNCLRFQALHKKLFITLTAVFWKMKVVCSSRKFIKFMQGSFWTEFAFPWEKKINCKKMSCNLTTCIPPD